MSKIFLTLGFAVISTLSFADGKVVYLDQNQLQQGSSVLVTKQQRIANQYNHKLSELQAQQEQLNAKLSKADTNPKVAAKLSTDLLNLQEQLNNLQISRDGEVQIVLGQYFAIERVVLKKMLEEQHYSYILNINSVYMAESVNDVTPTVIKLTDAAYEQKYSH